MACFLFVVRFSYNIFNIFQCELDTMVNCSKVFCTFVLLKSIYSLYITTSLCSYFLQIKYLVILVKKEILVILIIVQVTMFQINPPCAEKC